MYSTLSPRQSKLNKNLVVTKLSSSALAGDEQSIALRSHRLPVTIEGKDMSWDGCTETMTRTHLQLLIEGCPLVVLSQAIQLHIVSQNYHLEVLGLIHNVTPKGDAAAGQWSKVQIDLTYEHLDDVSWQRVKSILRDTTSCIPSSYIRGTIVPLDPGDCLWKMRLESSVAAIAIEEVSFHQRVGQVLQQIVESKESVQLPYVTNDEDQRTIESREIPIVSMPVEFPNQDGRMIRAYYDAPSEPLTSESPVIVLSPGYGETKREYIMLAYYFASNGFHVLRYDHTNHVGVSDGEHVQTTLSSMHKDLDAAVQYVTQRWPHSPRGLVATSLSGRVAIKAIAKTTHVDILILITPVVDVQQTLQVVHQEDLVGNYQQGERKGESNVLGFNVSVDPWLSNAIDEGFSNLSSTIQDVAEIRTPVVIVSAEHDAWVQHTSLTAMSSELKAQLQAWYVIPEGLHRIVENPRKAKMVYRQIMKHCQENLGLLTTSPFISEPTRKAIGIQNKKEREEMKAGMMTEELSVFWKDYLDHFHHIVNYGDYQQLLDQMLQLMGPVSSGETILDAGCGNGNFAPYFYLNERLKSQARSAETPSEYQYVGIDFVPNALHQAQQNLQTVVSQNQSESVAIDGTFSCTDLNQTLPFQDNTFDKVVSNLVLGYLTDPVATLRELFRVLAPNGTLVLSNLKPNSDLSVIYTNSIQETTEANEVEEARQLLSNSGKIRQAEGDGVFHFHDEDELHQLLQQANPNVAPRVYSTFGNQAYIAVMKKEALPSTQYDCSSTVFANAA